MICRQARMFLIVGASLPLLISIPGIADAQPSKADQKCINSVNKNAAKIVKVQGKDICACVKNGAKGKLGAQTIEQCLTADSKGKVAKAKSQLDDKIGKDCASYPLDPNGFAPVDPTDPNFIKARSMEKDISLIHWIFGSDLDSVIVKEADTTTPDAKNVSKCQQAVAKQAKKCQDTKLKQFLACKKDGMKGKTPPGQISSSEDLERLCLQADPNDPTTGQADPKGKISKACDDKLAGTIQKKCADKSVDLSVAFPGFDPNAGTLKDFVDFMVECEVCLYWNAIDSLDRDCDLFDDGLANGSCGEELPPSLCGDTFPACDGDCPPGDECTDTGGACTCEPVPPPACGDTFPACDGDCPPGDVCTDVGGSCACLTPPPPACGDTFPLCDGDCPPSETCTDLGGFCACLPPLPPCGGSAPPMCDGDCPPGASCVDTGAGCTCIPGGGVSGPCSCGAPCLYDCGPFGGVITGFCVVDLVSPAGACFCSALCPGLPPSCPGPVCTSAPCPVHCPGGGTVSGTCSFFASSPPAPEEGCLCSNFPGFGPGGPPCP